MFKGKMVILVAAAFVTGVCSAGISGSGKTSDGISGSGKTDSIRPACLLQIPFVQPLCFV